MLKENFIQIYEMDLQKVIKEVSLYETEADLWKLSDGITNSGGNLALHLIGNINHYFGAVLGGTDFKRERDLEFSDKKYFAGADCQRFGKCHRSFEKFAQKFIRRRFSERLSRRIRRRNSKDNLSRRLFAFASRLSSRSNQLSSAFTAK